MAEVINTNGAVIFGDIFTKDILNLSPNQTIEDIPDNFLINKERLKKTYKGNLNIKARINNEILEDDSDIYFHICYPMHIKMTDSQYASWTQKFSNSNTDERIIFIPNKEEG